MLIDVNAGFGGRESIQRFPVETMLEQLDRIPCDLAFVHSRQGASDATAAIDDTLALCDQRPWLRPVGVINPRDTFAWRQDLARCLAAGARLFRVYPDEAHWTVGSALFRPVVERLRGTGAVLLVDATTPGLPSQIAAATAEAGVPVIFTEARYYPLCELLPLAERYPHVYIETSRLTSPDGIELCVETVGAARLVFGSGTPRYPAGVAWQVLQDAAISDEDREAIAWRNAAKLLGVSPEAGRRDGGEPAPMRPLRGRPIIDVHLHDRFPGAPLLPVTPERYEAVLDRVGIVGGVASSVTGIFYDLEKGNEEMARLLDRIPRLRGYVVVDPRYHDDSVRELTRLERDPRFVGVKVHCSYSQTLTEAPSLRRLFGVIAGYGKPVLIHPLGATWPEALVEIAAAHPHLPIIAAHSGYGDAPHPTHDAALRVAPAPNIWLEFCSTYLATGAIRRGIEAVGVDRVLFGSDYPLISLPYMVAAYADAGLSDDEAARVLWRNARRLFGEAFAKTGGIGTAAG
jgi:predicted TIM-barrel fold metal-dependent hydrolase